MPIRGEWRLIEIELENVSFIKTPLEQRSFKPL
jgi:hypothetical protein